MSRQDQNSQQNETEIFYKNIAKQAIREIRQEEKAKSKQEALHNTKILLKRYLDIKDSMKVIKCHYMIANEEIWLKSIFRSKAVSKLYLNHVDTCIEILEDKFKGKAKVIRLMYLTDEYRMLSHHERIMTISEQSMWLMGVMASDRTIERYLADMISELSVLLFGADGLRIWTI